MTKLIMRAIVVGFILWMIFVMGVLGYILAIVAALLVANGIKPVAIDYGDEE